MGTGLPHAFSQIGAQLQFNQAISAQPRQQQERFDQAIAIGTAEGYEEHLAIYRQQRHGDNSRATQLQFNQAINAQSGQQEEQFNQALFSQQGRHLQPEHPLSTQESHIRITSTEGCDQEQKVTVHFNVVVRYNGPLYTLLIASSWQDVPESPVFYVKVPRQGFCLADLKLPLGELGVEHGQTLEVATMLHGEYQEFEPTNWHTILEADADLEVYIRRSL
jgi:hypothetical protein